MLGKIFRSVNPCPSGSEEKTFNRDVFLKTFFPSLIRFYDEHPELREKMNDDFRKQAFGLMADMKLFASYSSVSERSVKTRTRAEIDVLPEDTSPLFKKPRLKEQSPRDSPGDSPIPEGEGDDNEEDDDEKDDVENVTFHAFVDNLGSQYSEVCDEAMQIVNALRLLRCTEALRPEGPPLEWTKHFYGFNSHRRRRRQRKKKHLKPNDGGLT